MEFRLINRLAMLGIAFIGINDMLLSPDKNLFEIQEKVFMDMNDVAELEREVEERKRRNETELYFKGYKIVLK